ncbi:MAG: NCS2 family permease [Brevinema sp.]
MALLDKYFGLSEHKTNVRTEFLAGTTNFMAMAYILAVQPSIMTAAGMPAPAVAVSVAIVAAISCIFMGLYSNYPFALAPGMGTNIFFAFTMVAGGIFTWQQGLSLIFLSGVIFLVTTVFGFREAIANFLPPSIKLGIGAVVGVFLLYLGLKSAGIVTADAQMGMVLGNMRAPSTLLAILGLVLTIFLHLHNVRGSLLIAIVIVTIIGIPMGITTVPTQFISTPPSIEPIFFKLDFMGLLKPELLPFIFVFFIGDFFDTLGTLMGVADKAGFLDKNGNLPKIERPFFVDACSTIIGSLFGLTTVTTYVESAAGVSAGGRTGLTSVFTGLLFLLGLFFTPIILMVPGVATAPCLILIGIMLLDSLRHINYGTLDDTIAPLFMVIITAFSSSIATGISFGVVLHCLIKVVKGEGKKVHPGLYVLTAVFLYYLFR